MLLYAHSKGAAAFGRLCVETLINDRAKVGRGQPPSGGCVLKHKRLRLDPRAVLQPPSGGCVLKQVNNGCYGVMPVRQPPSGGCVLKLFVVVITARYQLQSPSGGCVLKQVNGCYGVMPVRQPPSGGCVLKQSVDWLPMMPLRSRLRAAVC